MLGISIPTIRMYERVGLIIPFRRSSRHRRFSATDLDRIRGIRRMINTEKISIEGVKRLLALIPCWKIRNCPEVARKSCQAFAEHTAPCWMVTGKSWDCKSAECRVCSVYSEFGDCRALKQIIAFHTLATDSQRPQTV